MGISTSYGGEAAASDVDAGTTAEAAVDATAAAATTTTTPEEGDKVAVPREDDSNQQDPNQVQPTESEEKAVIAPSQEGEQQASTAEHADVVAPAPSVPDGEVPTGATALKVEVTPTDGQVATSENSPTEMEMEHVAETSAPGLPVGEEEQIIHVLQVPEVAVAVKIEDIPTNDEHVETEESNQDPPASDTQQDGTGSVEPANDLKGPQQEVEQGGNAAVEEAPAAVAPGMMQVEVTKTAAEEASQPNQVVTTVEIPATVDGLELANTPVDQMMSSDHATQLPVVAEIPVAQIKTETDPQQHLVPEPQTEQKVLVTPEGTALSPPATHVVVLQGFTSEQVIASGQGEAASVGAENAVVKVESSGSKEVAAIWEPHEADVLSGRGASVNAHQGNKKFRALCFSRKREFEAGNHAAKRRIATEIVAATLANPNARFLKKKEDKGPWYEMTMDQAILKACQVMRDYKRPDRLAIREMMAQNGNARKRQRAEESTPMADTPVPNTPLDPIIENPFGVHDHDILSGRGAFVNGHIGNQRLRTLALERKLQFDSGNYTEKRALATEIVQHIRQLDPPGRFLRRVRDSRPSKGEDNNWVLPPRGLDGTWEELSDEKAIHKACQVMRDIDRPDRKDREVRRKKKQKLGDDYSSQPDTPVAAGTEMRTDGLSPAAVPMEVTQINEEYTHGGAEATEQDAKDSMKILAETSTLSEKATVEEAVAAAEAALDKALDDVPDKLKGGATMDVAETAIV